MAVIAVDFETANQDARSACAVGLAWIEGAAVTRREYRLIRPPEIKFDPINVRIHGIQQKDVERAGSFAEVISEFLPEFSGSLLLAHNATFDMSVLCASLVASGDAIPDFDFLCTLQLARSSWPALPSYKLSAIAQSLDITFKHHHAGDDAFACARIALEAVRVKKARDIYDLGSAARLIKSSREAHSGIKSLKKEALPILEFVVRGSTGNLYNINVYIRDHLLIKCGCVAGRFSRVCRHVSSLVDGEVSDLVSGNTSDVTRLAGMIREYGWP